MAKLNTYTENQYSAELQKSTSPKTSRVCGYIHPTIPVFAKFQAKYGVNENTTDADSLFIFMASKCGVEITQDDLNRNLVNNTEKQTQAVAQPTLAQEIKVPEMATADTSSVVVPELPKPDVTINKQLMAYIDQAHKNGVGLYEIKTSLIDAGNSKAIAEAHMLEFEKTL